MSNHYEDSSESLEDGELAEFVVDPVEELDAALLSLNSRSSNRRGRPRIQEQWTRVISIDAEEEKPVLGYELSTDLMLATV